MDVRKPRYLILTVAGVVVFFLLAFFAPELAPSLLSKAHANTVQGIMGSICASFVFLFVLDAAYLLLDAFYRREFRQFFGEMSDSHQHSTFVYPDFELSEKAHSALGSAKIAETEFYTKRAQHFTGTRFIQIPQIVASNDLLSIVIMATRLGHFLGDTPHIHADGWAVENHTSSIISLGLTSNAFTELYTKADPNPAFRIEDPAGDPTLIVLHDNTETRYGRNETEQHAIILRYYPERDTHSSRCWFICAGLGAAGTPAAAWALGHNWLRYHKRFRDKDFLVVLKTSNDVLPYINPTEEGAFVRDEENRKFVSAP
jgi:hypothetical protein